MSNFEYEYEKDKQYLKDYLIKKKSSAKSKYKRVCLSPLRYAGGKSKAVGLILENLPKLKEKKIVSPFFGGGSFELALTKELGYEVIGELLSSIHGIVQKHGKEDGDEEKNGGRRRRHDGKEEGEEGG